MNEFDYAVLAVFGLSVVLGLWRGLVREVLSLAAWVVAFITARELGWMGAQAMSSFFSQPAVQTLVGYGVVFFGALMLCSGVIALIRMLLSAAGLSVVDRVLGAVFGVARASLIVFLGVAAAGLTAVPKQDWWQEAKFSPPLETAVLAAKPWLPEGLAQRIRFPTR